MSFLFLKSGLGFGFCLSLLHGLGTRIGLATASNDHQALRLTGLLSLARSSLAGSGFHFFFFLKASASASAALRRFSVSGY
jgi:hypothetical protein